MTIPTTTRAACVHNHGPNFSVQVEDVPTPSPGVGEILIRLNVTGLCYSDIHYMLEDLPLPKMRDYNVRSPGHEGVGKVVAVGEGVSNWAIGDRAGVKPVWSTCADCELCSGDREMYCAETLQTGLQRTGTYQQYLLASSGHAIKIPDELDDVVAAPILCSGATAYRGLSESGVVAGQWIVISGAAGGVGHMTIQYARAMGLRVIAIDGGEDKGKLCMGLGAAAYVDFLKVKDIPAEVVRLTDGLGAHGAFITASNGAAYRGMPQMVRVGGVIMCIGLPPPGTADAGGDPIFLIGKNLRLTGTIVGTKHDVRRALALAAHANIRPVIETYPLKDIALAVDKLRHGKANGRLVVKFDD